MKIKDAQDLYARQLDTLMDKRQTLLKKLEENGDTIGSAAGFDKVELSRELSELEVQYKATQNVVDEIAAKKSAIQNCAAYKRQGEAVMEQADEMLKMLEIYRRIASGGKVPPEDEQRLMDYSTDMYMAAKAAAILHEGESEEYDSVFADEEKTPEEQQDPVDIVDNAEIAVPSPEAVAAAAAAEISAD